MSDFFNDAVADVATNPNAGKDEGREPIPAGKYKFLIADAVEVPYIYGIYKEEEMATAMAADPSISPGLQFRFKFECLEPEYNDKKIFADMVTQPASNHPTFGKLTPDVLVKINKTNFRALLVRSRVAPDVLKRDGISALLNRVVELPVIVKVSKKGKKFNEIEYVIKEGEVIGEVSAPEGSKRPTATDDAPF